MRLDGFVAKLALLLALAERREGLAEGSGGPGRG